MDADEYLKARIDDQITWYDKKSQWNQKWFKRLQSAVIGTSALIPLLVGYSDVGKVKFTVGLLGSAGAVMAGVVSLYRFKELWVEYRTTAETIKHEKFLYLTRKGPYDVEDPFAVLVERVETLISRENTLWYECLHKRKDARKDV
jgi:hypothetical protein